MNYKATKAIIVSGEPSTTPGNIYFMNKRGEGMYRFINDKNRSHEITTDKFLHEYFEPIIDEKKTKYWNEITNIQQKQTIKGLMKYGQVLEENEKLTDTERLTYLEEELVDGLMYIEHIKAKAQESMSANDYQKLAMRTASLNTEMKIPNRLILNGALGLGGESGEVQDLIKKFMFQGHELNEDKLREELGDICWYIAMLAEGLNYPLEEVLKANIEKLKKRYPAGFEVERSLHRPNEQ